MSENKKIIQIIPMPNDFTWQGALLGLGNDGVLYRADNDGWTVYIENNLND